MGWIETAGIVIASITAVDGCSAVVGARQSVPPPSASRVAVVMKLLTPRGLELGINGFKGHIDASTFEF